MAVEALALAVVSMVGLAVWTRHRIARRKRAAEARYPPTGPLIEVGGIRVHAHVTHAAGGPLPDLVLIHGASGNTRDFTFDLVDRLSAHYRVIAFDRPGLGHSDSLGDAGVSVQAQADLLRAAAGKLGITRPILLGQSYGGAVALAWALDDPENTAALVLVAAVSQPWPGGLGPWYPLAASWVGKAIVIPLLAAFAPLGRARDVLRVIFAPQAAPARYERHIGVGLTLRRETIRMNARQVHGLKAEVARMVHRYPELRLPVEIVHGTADTIVPARLHAEPLARQVPGARLTLRPGIGHMLHHADPEAVVAAVDRAALRARLRIDRQSP